MFIIYVIDSSTKNKNVRGFIFSQKSKIQTVGNGKKKFFSAISFQKLLAKEFIFWERCRLKTRFFAFSYFRFSYNYFSKQLLMASEDWVAKYFSLAPKIIYFPFPFFCTIWLFLICISFKFVYFSHVKAVLSVYLKCFKNVSAWFKMILRRWFNYLSYNFILLITVEMHQNKKFFLI